MLEQLRKVSRFCYRHRGLARLGEFVRRATAKLPLEVAIDDFDGDLRLNLKLDEHMSSQIFWRGAYAGAELAVVEALLRPDDVFLDVGANLGEFTLFAAKRLPHGKVLAFEPTRATFARLQQHVAQNGLEKNVLLRRQGLSAASGAATIFEAEGRFRDGTFHSGLASIYRQESHGEEVRTQTIELVALDEVFEALGQARLDVVKMDIEGAELAALRGARETLARHRPVILLEANARTCERAGYELTDLWEELNRHGYRYLRIEGGRENMTLRGFRPEDAGEFQNIMCLAP